MLSKESKELLTELQKARDAAYTRVTAMLAHGNKCLLAGNYATEEDIAKMRDLVAKYEFRAFCHASAKRP